MIERKTGGQGFGLKIARVRGGMENDPYSVECGLGLGQLIPAPTGHQAARRAVLSLRSILNEWAVRNGIVVLYPRQSTSSQPSTLSIYGKPSALSASP